MRLTYLLAVSLLCAQVSGSCSMCGALSEDYCTCRGLRPNPRILIGSPALVAAHSSGNCQCSKHLVEEQPQTYFKNIPVSVVYAQPLCPSCAAAGKPVCGNCVSNCKPLCNKCALYGKPVCNACVASIGYPTVKAYNLSDEQAESSNSAPQKVPPSSSGQETSEQSSKSNQKYVTIDGSNSYVEITETKSNLNPQLLGLRKFFGYSYSNNDQSEQSKSQTSETSESNDIKKNNANEKKEQEGNNSNSGEATKPQALYITYTGLGYLPDKTYTKIIAFPSTGDQEKSKMSSASSSEVDYHYKSSGTLLELLKF